jgi:hypothetical protein
VHDAGLLELEEWGAKRRKVVFYVPEVTSILIDGRPVTFHSDESRHFQIIEMKGKNFQFNSSQAGVLMYSGNTFKVTLPSK